jgi:hypothetical protein
LQAVYRDDARPARGQQPHGRAADHACGAGDNGNPAIQADAIGHGGVPLPFCGFSLMFAAFRQYANPSAANFKFLSVSRQVRDRNLKFKAALESTSC